MKPVFTSTRWIRAIGLATAALVVGARLDAQAEAPEREIRWDDCLDQPPGWYTSAEAVRIADNVLSYQHPNGGWSKNVDMARRLGKSQRDHVLATIGRTETTIDNSATYTQIEFLARVYNATHHRRFADAAVRGIEYLLAAQYENGGWPQFYPLKRGYYSHVTFNDGAMIGVMRVLRDVSRGEPPFEFVDAELRTRAARAIDKGLDVILKCQVVVDGRLTAWCAQHDEVDFRPAKARAYELPSLSGMESFGIVCYLMQIDDPSPEVRQAVRGAVEWFDAAKIEGLHVHWKRDASQPGGIDFVAEPDPSAPPVWARFYEIGTNRPLFVGRDGVPHDHLADIEHERRVEYAWLGPWARELLEEYYPAWEAKWGPAD